MAIGVAGQAVGRIRDAARRAKTGLFLRMRLPVRSCELAGEELGQGTTEYAILVGVLVLMAIVAVVAFRGRLQELWTEITDGINSL